MSKRLRLRTLQRTPKLVSIGLQQEMQFRSSLHFHATRCCPRLNFQTSNRPWIDCRPKPVVSKKNENPPLKPPGTGMFLFQPTPSNPLDPVMGVNILEGMKVSPARREKLLTAPELPEMNILSILSSPEKDSDPLKMK